MSIYYNEHDTVAAAWLRALIVEGVLPDGDVDERDLQQVTADDLKTYSQCHFFAGIGGWPYALTLAGWPADRPVWSGSCPCQPFSAAGRGAGPADPHHLWPTWSRLIAECRPPVVIGEQVASADGRAWLDLVYADLEGMDYAVGAADLCAAGVGAPHIRQRLFFVADTDESTRQRRAGGVSRTEASSRGQGKLDVHQPDRLADGGDVGIMGDTDSTRRQRRNDIARAGENFDVDGSGPWDACDWLPCRDGKARPVEPGTFPLAHGVSGRVGRLRGYGNAIVPQVAATFIRAYLEVC